MDIFNRHDIRSAYLECKIIGECNQEETDKIDGTSEMNVRNVKRVVFVCRRGNDSQIARQILERHFDSKNCDKIIICDIIGGLEAWANRIDANFPKY